jgi:hypothetical protein
MRNSLIVSVMSGLLLVPAACRDNQPVTPKEQGPFPTGRYEGTFVMISTDTLGNNIVISQPCRIGFSGGEWVYSEIPDSEESPWNECDVVGEYRLVDHGLRMDYVLTHWIRWSCDLAVPSGLMQITEQGDSVILFREERFEAIGYTFQQCLRLVRRCTEDQQPPSRVVDDDGQPDPSR